MMAGNHLGTPGSRKGQGDFLQQDFSEPLLANRSMDCQGWNSPQEAVESYTGLKNGHPSPGSTTLQMCDLSKGLSFSICKMGVIVACLTGLLGS